MIRLSQRLQNICDMVPSGVRICDVGCDHAYADIRLLQERKVVHALAMDVAEGPLAAARANLELTELLEREEDAGREGLCEVRRSDGLAAYVPGEAEVLICAGMGGILMRCLLEAEPEKALSFREMILSPHREINLVREWLFANGCRILEERFLQDEGKYYTVMHVRCPEEGSTLRTENPPASETERPEAAAGSPESTAQEPAVVSLQSAAQEPAAGGAESAVQEPPAQRRPDWRRLAERIEELPEETLARAMVSRGQLLRILGDAAFHRLAEENWGPCILADYLAPAGAFPAAESTAAASAECFDRFVRERLRGKLQLLEKLSASEAGGSMEERLQQVRGEVGILQTLLAAHRLCGDSFREGL